VQFVDPATLESYGIASMAPYSQYLERGLLVSFLLICLIFLHYRHFPCIPASLPVL